MINVVKGERADIIELSNEDIQVSLSNFGATILSIKVKDKNNQWQNVVIGYSTIDEYMAKDGTYMGAVVGRVANRIGKASFNLNGIEYKLDANNGPNCLHGGINGFSYQLFDYQMIGNGVIFNYLSKDNDQGFPGNLEFSVIYTIDGPNLDIQYQGQCDRDTIMNITNHTYFNLDGNGEDISNHKLLIHSYYMGKVDSDGLYGGDNLDVRKETIFDFNNYKRIGDIFNQDNQQVKIVNNGLDNPFIFNRNYRQVKLYSPTSGIKLVVDTSYPSAHIYTSNWFDSNNSIYNHPLKPHAGIAIETSYLANSINWQDNSPTILKKGKTYHERTRFHFGLKAKID